MSANSYETGRLNLPFVGISTFGKRPYVADWSGITADAAKFATLFHFFTLRLGQDKGPRET